MTFYVRYRERDTSGRLVKDILEFFTDVRQAFEHYQEVQNDGLPPDREYRLELGDMTMSRSEGRGLFE